MTSDQAPRNPHAAFRAFSFIASGAGGDKISFVVYIFNFQLVQKPSEKNTPLNSLHSEQVIDGYPVLVQKPAAIRAKIKIPSEQPRVGFEIYFSVRGVPSVLGIVDKHPKPMSFAKYPGLFQTFLGKWHNPVF